jgi:hypothetical protein
MALVNELAGKVGELADLMHTAVSRLFIMAQEQGTEMELLKASLARLERDNMALHSRVRTAERSMELVGVMETELRVKRTERLNDGALEMRVVVLERENAHLKQQVTSMERKMDQHGLPGF